MQAMLIRILLTARLTMELQTVGKQLGYLRMEPQMPEPVMQPVTMRPRMELPVR